MDSILSGIASALHYGNNHSLCSNCVQLSDKLLLFMIITTDFCSGETEENRLSIIQGQADTLLNELGRQQARMAAEKLSRETFTSIYSSDLLRAKEVYTSNLTAPSMLHAEKLEVAWGRGYFKSIKSLSLVLKWTILIITLQTADIIASSLQEKLEILTDMRLREKVCTENSRSYNSIYTST